MFEKVLKRMQGNIRNRQYVMTLHAEEEMDDDNLTIFDIEHGILSGEIRGRRYRIRGNSQNKPYR